MPDTNADVLDRELTWMSAVLDARFTRYFAPSDDTSSGDAPSDDTPSDDAPSVDAVLGAAPPLPTDDAAPYAAFVRAHGLDAAERLVLALALAPHLRPQALDLFFVKNTGLDRGFTEFGGLSGSQHGGFLPTGETVAFVLAGTDLARRLAVHALFGPDHVFRTARILSLTDPSPGEPPLSGGLHLSADARSRLLTGVGHAPEYGSTFPAQRLTTRLSWDDLVLDAPILDEVEEIRAWIEHGETLLDDWGLRRILAPGFRSLFHGPPGTGKTLTASLLGESTGRPVYRVDLSLVVSKYVGETEKNLAGVFDRAAGRGWILFFDEADALFGRRTTTQDARDRYANQEVAYLLQRVESFPGVVILASNLKGNIDDAFARRFQSMIYFPVPGPTQRLQLWRQCLPPGAALGDDVDLAHLADDYELTGGAIVNVVRYAALRALRNDARTLRHADFLHGIRREYRKDGRLA